MDVAVQSVNEKFQAYAMSVLLAEGTTDSDVDAVPAATDLASHITASRKIARDNGAKPNTLIVSTRIFGFMLEEAGKKIFP